MEEDLIIGSSKEEVLLHLWFNYMLHKQGCQKWKKHEDSLNDLDEINLYISWRTIVMELCNKLEELIPTEEWDVLVKLDNFK